MRRLREVGSVRIELSVNGRNEGALALYESEETRAERIEEAVNAVNDRYGELMLLPAAVAASKNPMKDRIPFGSVRYLD